MGFDPEGDHESKSFMGLTPGIQADGPLAEGNWVATGWWLVVAPDGSIWCETSDQSEAMERKREGDKLFHLYEKKSTQWKHINTNESGKQNG